MPQIWYHGDQARRGTFADQRMDRDRTLQDGNAMGPGIYWTSDKDQARGYAWPNGWVYSATVHTKPRRVMTVEVKPTRRLLDAFIKLAPLDSRATGYSNWGEQEATAHRNAVAAYMKDETLLDALVAIYHDFYQNNGEAYAAALVELGFDAYLHRLPEVDHLVVWNAKTIRVTAEEKYTPEE